MNTITELISEAKVLNSKAVSLPRILILLTLKDLQEDGATYRELKIGLEMADGILYSNLNALEEMGYLKSNDITLENKKMTSYSITQEGKEALNSLCSWFRKWVR